MLSTRLPTRRSERTTALPQRLEDEQATHQYHAQELLDLRRATELSLAAEQPDSSDEDTVTPTVCSRYSAFLSVLLCCF